MATLSSTAITTSPLLPWHVGNFTEDHTSELKLTPWGQQKGVTDPLPIRFAGPLPCESPVQSKHGIAGRNNGRKKGESFEAIVGSCISRAVAFSDRQFRVILKSFSDSSASKNAGHGDVRCNSAGKTYSNDPIDSNGNGNGGNKGGGSGSEVGFPDGGRSGGRVGGNYLAMGANWWRRQCQSCTQRGTSALVAMANQGQLYHHATTQERAVEWIAQVAITRALTHPMVGEIMQLAIIAPLQVFVAMLIILTPRFMEDMMVACTAFLVAGSAATVVLLWLLWMWWRSRGLGDENGGDEGAI